MSVLRPKCSRASRRVTPAPSRTAKARARRRGFTLVELMIGLVVTSSFLVVAYGLVRFYTREFQRHERLGQLQLPVRMAMERIRRDVSLAGFMSAADTSTLRLCQAPPSRLTAVSVIDRSGDSMSALSGLAGAPVSGVHGDSLRIFANYATTDSYLTQSIDGTRIVLQQEWQSFRRSFLPRGGGTEGVGVDQHAFEAVFAPGTMLHVTQNGNDAFVTISATDFASGALTVTPALRRDITCIAGLGRGAYISPVQVIEYAITTPPAGYPVSRDAVVTGANTVLVRRDLNPTTLLPVAGSERVVLEYAIHFDVDVIGNTAPIGSGLMAITRLDDAAAAAFTTNSPGQLLGVAISVSARTPEQDPDFAWVPPAAGDPLSRFLVFPDRAGAARVRTATAELSLPNLLHPR